MIDMPLHHGASFLKENQPVKHNLKPFIVKILDNGDLNTIDR